MERVHFEDELKTLKQRLLNMGALVEERVHRSVMALMERRPELAEEVVAGDREINDLQIEIDDTERIFSNPSVQATEDYISGRFG